MLALDERPVAGDDYHAFWEIWNAHAAKFAELTIAPEDEGYADDRLDWMREVADSGGYFRAASNVPPRGNNSLESRMTAIEQFKVDVDRMYQSLFTLGFADAELHERLLAGYELVLAEVAPEGRAEASAYRDLLHRTYFPAQ